MAEATTAVSHEAPVTANGTLFRGKHFWLSHNVPQRNRFKDLIQQHGGHIRLFEKDAEIKIVDHKRRNLPPDTYSFKFIEDSIRKGRMQNLEPYRAGPSEARPVGASYIPTRNHKVPYTVADDQLLWDWMQKYERDSTASISGNKIYQELAAKNPRHTFQSWRDRYLKRLRGRPRPGGMPKGSALEEKDSQEVAPAQVTAPTAQTQPPAILSREHEVVPSSSKPADKKRKRVSETGDEADQPDPMHRSAPKRRTAEPVPERVAAAPARLQHKGNEPVRPPPPQIDPKASIGGEKLSPTTNGVEQQSIPEQTETGTDKPQNGADPAPIPPEIDPLFLQLPFLPSSPEPEPVPDPQPEIPEQDIDTWIDRRLRNGRATEAQIIEALRCTSMDPDLADKVLEFLVAGKDIPDDIPGVWTTGDDRCVEGKETRGIQRVLEKHGAEAFDARWEYLSMARAAGLETETIE
ncbi:putative transcription factor Rap1 [Aspergillus fijiensis CBS 313.89]|uniref:DNA-binding protein RAP1 n=1 Tax=Aspergillus fijiensis CBS 313.89 TaxID=1448319 RepID=A0A8G1RMP9_9EURO|nr:uncharacterized protein BO72DRAFT_437662 [Aspergillus fijiensis CBS 313.89]RAK73311.1 hypothetical protein BO72DRAFT_437662 [Aspergillus fijiensis CBS 313.89]